MRPLLPLAAVCAILGGCSDPGADADGDGEITMEEAAAKAKTMVRPEPGKYSATSELVSVDVPGAPKEVQDMMRKMMDRGPQTTEYCLTPEDAEKGFEEMLRQSQASGNECTFEKFDTEGTQIDAVMVCEKTGQGTVRMTMEGTGGETSSDMTISMDAQDPAVQRMIVVMKNTQKRLGSCEG